jgi:hypothetical protein
VEEILEIPLAFFLSSLTADSATLPPRRQDASAPVYRYQDYCIWGATAQIVEQCAVLLTDQG